MSSSNPDCDVTSPVGRTALYIAACRAQESKRPMEERIFHDPFASDFAGTYGKQFLTAVAEIVNIPGASVEKKEVILSDAVAIRTTFLDNVVLNAVKENPNVQVVIFAVGCDCRGIRLPIPETASIFELDLPEMMERRKQVLAPLLAGSTIGDYDAAFVAAAADRYKRTVSVGCDLGAQDDQDGTQPLWRRKLLENGFDVTRPSVVVVEGLVMYLEEEQVRGLFKALGSILAPGSRVAGDILTAAHLTSPMTAPLREIWAKYGSPITCGFTTPEPMFVEAGFEVQSVWQAGENEHCDFGRVNEASKKFMVVDNPRGCPIEEHIPRNLYFILKK